MAVGQDPVSSKVSFHRILYSHSRGAFSPRLGRAIVKTKNGSEIRDDSPGLITLTSRGVIPHLTQDHVRKTDAIKSVYVLFEAFLERSPPIPILIGGEKPLQTVLGLREERHILTMSLRDPLDSREMPPNGNKFLNANCIRGVRKMSPEQYRSLVRASNPDLVIALSDIPFTPPPFSQRRITKSLERSAAWLASLLQPAPDDASDRRHPLNILVQMAGGVSDSARRAFAYSLTETLFGKDAKQIKPFKCLDDGVLGYVFDLIPLRMSLLAPEKPASDDDGLDLPNRRAINSKALTQPCSEAVLPRIVDLLHASLETLSPEKPRFVTGTSSPHEVLHLIRDVGIDFFDVGWAQKAADWGIALDFVFPVPKDGEVLGGNVRDDGKRDLGHNIYSPQYATDFVRLADSFLDGASETQNATHICPCIACSPVSPFTEVTHASIDVLTRAPALDTEPTGSTTAYDLPFTRAYTHHLLHTHEMSAHALLAAHNLAVTDAFFTSVRHLLARGTSHTHHPHLHRHGVFHADVHPETETIVGASSDTDFASLEEEVERFCATYDGTLGMFSEGKRDWIAVDYARGKGRLGGEKAKQGEEDLATRPETRADVDEAALN